MRARTTEAVACGWCKARFEVDPRDGALPYQCPECPEQLSLGSLRYPNLNSKAISIHHHVGDAVAENLRRHSLAFVYSRRKSRAGSGTLVSIGNRLLIATAGHTVPESPEHVTLVGKRTPYQVECAPAILAVARSEVHDVGLIEVACDAPGQMGMEPIGIGRIADLGSGRHHRSSWLVGYPSASQIPNSPKPGVLGFVGHVAACEPIDPIAWHRIKLGKDDDPLDPDGHAMFYYSVTDPLFVHPDNPCRDEFAARPHGMSGGGFWQAPQSTEGRNWYPHDVCLYAIQSAWCFGHMHVKAIQIIHWLRLVADTYQHLREELIDAFPRLLEISEDL